MIPRLDNSISVVQFPSMLQAYGGLGRALPINRGAGVNQKLLLDFARLIAAGERFVVWSCLGCACSHISCSVIQLVSEKLSTAHILLFRPCRMPTWLTVCCPP
jgi:hypothetical protein